MSIELPALYIYPNDYGTIRPNGLQAPFPAAMIGRAIEERSAGYAQGHWREMLKLHLPKMQHTRPIAFTLDDFLIRELKAGSAADAIMLANSSVSIPDAWNKAFEYTKANLDTAPLAQPIEFSGGWFTPFRAIAHWVLGKGQRTKVNINNIGITPELHKSPQLLATFAGASIGTSRIDVTFPYNTGMDSNISRIFLGSITLRVIGDLNKDSDGNLIFAGVARAYSDKYDANASSHRGGFDENATTLLREVGRVANAQDYEILIEGELPLNISN